MFRLKTTQLLYLKVKMFKATIKKLESYMDKKHPEFKARFYINRKNKLIHVVMDTAIFEKANFRLYLWDCECFMKEAMTNIKFEFFRVPTLINCTKWKYDYIIARRETTH